MIPFRLSVVKPELNAEQIGQDVVIHSVTTNSSRIGYKALFIALRGNKFNGHQFINQAISLNAIAILVNHRLPINIPQLIVNDTTLALGLLSRWIRKRVSTRIIAITGSSGKTSVKEMTSTILRQRGKVLSTYGNLNNEIGVPITLLRLKPEYEFAVVELGANHLGEIAWTTNLVQPETALINNISPAHLEGFGSISGVAKGKGEIFIGVPPEGRAVINIDSHDYSCWKISLRQKKIWRFALQKTNKADFFASNIQNHNQGVSFRLHSPNGVSAVNIPIHGLHNVSNALAASALAMSVGVDLDTIILGLSKLKLMPGRLFPFHLGPGQLLIDDSYNANIGSMNAAIQVLANMPGYRVMIVGDMAELGEKEIECHRLVGKTISLTRINKVLSIGSLGYFISKSSGFGEHFYNKTALISRVVQLLSKNKIITILVKASRSSKMEIIVRAIQEKSSC